MRRDLGDFQTPPALVAEVLGSLFQQGECWTRVLEPTCGSGAFIEGLLRLPAPPREIQGIEIQKSYVENSVNIINKDILITVKQGNIFNVDLGRDLNWREHGPLLVVGNPPWVTNAELGVLGGANLPRKSNIKGLRGIDAMTGESNFDIAEFIYLKLIQELATEKPTIALLCKTSVARNVLLYAARAGLPVERATIRRIDARKWFDAAVDACLFRVQVGAGTGGRQAKVYRDLYSKDHELTIGVVGGQLVADLAAYERSSFADGPCPLVWRQGLKHDAAPVMELTAASGTLRNKLGTVAAIEEECVYPLLKCGDLYNRDRVGPRRFVIVTQHALGADTRGLAARAPRLWHYLRSNSSYFEKRKSSIYRNRAPFAMFGIGDYSFSPYKVAISGLHKSPRFRAVGPVQGRPVMFDDACYFLPCTTPERTAVLACLLNEQVSRDLIHSLVFWDSKRPITKKTLQRIDLKILMNCVDQSALIANAQVEFECLTGISNQRGDFWKALLAHFWDDPETKGKRTIQTMMF